MAASNAIHQTTDYSQFKTKKGNRQVNAAHVEKVMKAIKKNNMLSANPIIINKAGEVIDGQHRLAAAKRLKQPIYYVVFDPASLSEIQLLNTTIRKWNPQDFINSYIATGRRDYVILKDFIDKYHFPLTASLWLLGQRVKKRKERLHDLFRNGEFKVYSLKEAEEKANLIDRLLAFSASRTHQGRGQGARFYEAIVSLIHKDKTLVLRLERQLVEHNLKIYRMDTTRDYMRQFEDILNKGMYSKRIRLY